MKICFWKRNIDSFECGSLTQYYSYLTVCVLFMIKVKIKLNVCDDIKPQEHVQVLRSIIFITLKTH